MATQLNWRPGGGIVAFVPEDRLPNNDLPPEATPIQLDGKPAFHVTLIGRRVMEPYQGRHDDVVAGHCRRRPGTRQLPAQPCS